jgi:hypothetical protein
MAMLANLFGLPEAWPFLLSGLLLIALTLIELAAQLIGMGGAAALDAWILGENGMDIADSWLGWLHVGKVPILVLLIIFLTFFSLSGAGLLLLAKALFGLIPPAWLAGGLAALIALPGVRTAGGVLGRLIPRDETSAVSLDSLVGQVATVISGTARVNYPAQARVRNPAGQQFYVHVEPDDPAQTLATGDAVLLVRQLSGARFQAIANPRPDLL